jgi:predicted AAA+ superfamily ATPase
MPTVDMSGSMANTIPSIARRLDLHGLLERKSHFLFGPRQTGKSFLIAHTLKQARVYDLYDLLDTTIYLSFSRDPGRLAQELTRADRIVVIDEIQRLPVLLNEVHRLIEQRGIRFLLTGSSARKLRRGRVLCQSAIRLLCRRSDLRASFCAGKFYPF